jgi:hypothetical protein
MLIVHAVFEGLTGITYILNYYATQEKTKLAAFKAGAASAKTKAVGARGNGGDDEIEVAP